VGSRLSGEGLVAQGSGILAVLAGLAALASVLLLEMWHGANAKCANTLGGALCGWRICSSDAMLRAIGAF